MYGLLQLDGGEEQILRFLKREGEGYPGNKGHYGGTNLQSVLRACLDRVRYLDKQISCDNNTAIICHLEHAILELEQRAGERHGFNVKGLSRNQACTLPMCESCGHVICMHQ